MLSKTFLIRKKIDDGLFTNKEIYFSNGSLHIFKSIFRVQYSKISGPFSYFLLMKTNTKLCNNAISIKLDISQHCSFTL